MTEQQFVVLGKKHIQRLLQLPDGEMMHNQYNARQVRLYVFSMHMNLT